MIVEFQANLPSASGFGTVSLGVYEEVPTLPQIGTRVRLILADGASSPFRAGQDVYGIVAASPELTIYVPAQGIDAMIFLDNVRPSR